jgi:hypothetical protein
MGTFLDVDHCSRFICCSGASWVVDYPKYITWHTAMSQFTVLHNFVITCRNAGTMYNSGVMHATLFTSPDMHLLCGLTWRCVGFSPALLLRDSSAFSQLLGLYFSPGLSVGKDDTLFVCVNWTSFGRLPCHWRYAIRHMCSVSLFELSIEANLCEFSTDSRHSYYCRSVRTVRGRGRSNMAEN